MSHLRPDARTLVPRRGIQALDEFVALARSRDWSFLSVDDTRRAIWVFQFGAAGCEVDFVDDQSTFVPHIIVGEGAGQAELIAEVARGVDAFTEKELFRGWDFARSDEERVPALLRLGVAAPLRYAAPYGDRIRAGLSDANGELRAAAITALAVRSWPEWVGDVEAFIAGEPVELNRRAAEEILAHLRWLVSVEGTSP